MFGCGCQGKKKEKVSVGNSLAGREGRCHIVLLFRPRLEQYDLFFISKWCAFVVNNIEYLYQGASDFVFN